MTDRKFFILAHDLARSRALDAVRTAPVGYRVDVRAPTRSLDQNAKLWALLGDIAQQVDWHGQKLSADDWKDMATAALKRQRVVPGLDGGFVVLGQRTSKMTRSEMAELIEFLYALGAERGVVWSCPARMAG